jgi:chromosomal replication initiation ATPase DnaA
MIVLSLFKGVIETDSRGIVRPPLNPLRALLRETAEDHGLEPETLLSKSRCHPIAHPRQDFMWRARQMKRADGTHRFSSPRIAAFLGLSDHTTVLHGVKAHAKRARGRGQ